MVDNADVPAVLGVDPGTAIGNTVLVTSRDHRPSEWGRHAVIQQIPPISDADGSAVLPGLAPEAGTDAQRLAHRLVGLPLVLMLGAYLARTSTGPVLPEAHHLRTFADYLAALDR
jgi:hypothetical protein